ncbi:palmitoyltransferase swf1 [Recurvomyces mirabilis]|nr:palmitoyltransferase swf1 [Recurvomyces mirabilis]
MTALKNILIAILVLSLLTFVVLFGQLPALRRTPIGWLQRLLCLRLPNGLRKVDRRLTDGRLTAGSTRFATWLFYEKNPVVLILFLFLLTGASTLFIWNASSLLPISLLVPIPLLLALPYWSTYATVVSKVDYITAENIDVRLRDYPYDHVLFHPGISCTTCNRPKPARSKHCGLCGVCVAKCDHHCPWVNNCLGRANYRYFLLLLLSLGVLQIYGAYLAYYILQPELTYKPRGFMPTKSPYWSDLGLGMVNAINKGGLSIAGVGLLAASTALLPLGLLAYHCYLIWAGTTTNESQKWADWQDDMKDGYAFVASRDQLQMHNRSTKPGDKSTLSNGRRQTTDNPALGYGLDGMEQVEVVWPVTSDEIIVRTSDGNPPQGQEVLWKQVWNLDGVVNVYDLGGWQNFVAVLKGR